MFVFSTCGHQRKTFVLLFSRVRFYKVFILLLLLDRLLVGAINLQKWSAFPHADSFSLYFKLFHKAKLSSHPRKKDALVREVTLYYYNRQKFFRLVGLACASQFVFWAWMAYFQLSRVQFADLLNLESKKSQEKILDVSSKPGVSWKVVRFVEVSSQIFQVLIVCRCAIAFNILTPPPPPPHPVEDQPCFLLLKKSSILIPMSTG